MSSVTKRRLSLLEDFRKAVWGNDLIFKLCTTHQSPTVEYLDFGNHLKALRSFCSSLVETDKLLVLEEYRNAMNEFNSPDTYYRRGACITGQPGIGKSMFIAYAVVERLRKEQPVAVQLNMRNRDDAYVLFSANGVTPYDGSDTEPLEARPGIWALSDSNAHVVIPTFAFTGTAGVRVFQTTSPSAARWKQWTKETGVMLYFMDLPSDKEIKDLARVFGHDVEQMKTFAEKWGRVPRTLLMLCGNPRYEDILQDMTTSHAETAAGDIGSALGVIREGDNPRFPGASSIFFTSPRKENNIISRHRVIASVPTDWITSILGDASLRLNVTKKINFFNTMSVHPETRGAAGWLFKKLMHHFLTEGGKPMSIHWHEGDAERTEEFTPLRSELRTNVDDFLRDPPFHWHPQEKGFEGIDGALVTKDHVLLLQMTLKRTHTSPANGVAKVWSYSSKTLKGLKWKLLFIGRDEERIKNVAYSYAEELQYGDMGTRSKTKDPDSIQRRHLPVGHVAIRPEKEISEGFQFTNVDRANIDHGPGPGSTGAALGVSQGGEEAMDMS